jgi:hypothetical protein
MKFFYLLLITVWISACDYKPSQKNDAQTGKIPLREPKSHSEGIPSSFFDSISYHYEMSSEQIKNQTTIDPQLYKDPAARFTGDSVFYIRPGYLGAFLRLDDKKSCIYRILLVFREQDRANTSYKVIESDCDRYQNFLFIDLSYRILNDSSIETTETLIPPYSEKGKKDNQIKTNRWRIDDRGLIVEEG